MHVLKTDARSDDPATRGATYLFNNWQGHGQQVANLARDIAQELGLPDGAAARVEKAARFHDIGKSRLPNCFEGSEDTPEELSRPERELLMSHTWLGYRILQSEPTLDGWVSDAALLHHEWWNGNGYPLGLARSDIPLVARIVAVADAYTTLLEQRPCAGEWHIDGAVTQIENKAGIQFDPKCADALTTVISRTRPSLSNKNFSGHAALY